MHRFILDPNQTVGEVLRLTGPEAKHAVQVLRLRPDDSVEILGGQGTVCSGRIRSVQRGEVLVTVLKRTPAPPLPYRLTLVQAIPKGKTMDTIVQKATELGTQRIVPILTERTEVRLDAERGESKVEKWQAVASEAMKQCGCPWRPRIEAPMPFERSLAFSEPGGLAVVASLEPDARHPRQRVEASLRADGQPPREVTLWIGPEGDFSPAEYARLKQIGAQPFSLGPFVLRCDTAAIAALACFHSELRWLGSTRSALDQ